MEVHSATARNLQPAAPSRAKNLLRRLGVAGFAFFFIKGLLWLLVPAVIYLFRG